MQVFEKMPIVNDTLSTHIDWLRKKITETPYASHDDEDELMRVILEMELRRRNIDLTIDDVNTIVNLKRSISHHLGDFWQRVLGDAPGWQDLGIGHNTGCDIRNDERKIVIELKNKMTTMNSSSKSSVLKKLQEQQDNGYTSFIGIVNGKGRTCIDKKTGIQTVIGAELFKLVYGSTSLLADVVTVVKEQWLKPTPYDIDALSQEFMQKAMVNE